MFGAVSDSKEKAIKFYAEHVEEVKKHVHKDQLLVWEVRVQSILLNISYLAYYCTIHYRLKKAGVQFVSFLEFLSLRYHFLE